MLEKLGELEEIAKSGGIEDTLLSGSTFSASELPCARWRFDSPEEEITALLEAIRITAPRFNPAKINSRPYYSLEEVGSSAICIAYSHMGDHKKRWHLHQLHTM